MLWIIIGIAVSYLTGSVPTAYVMGRVLKGIDIRKFGSGNVGATNAWRVLGKGPGILVLLVDAFKGVVPVVFIANFVLLKQAVFPEGILRIILGLTCIVGHNWTVFLNFKGGKGIATTLGVLIGLSIQMPGLRIAMLAVVVTWAIIFALTKIISAASVIAAISLPVFMAIFHQPKYMLVLSIMLSILALIRHKSNIVRLLQGKEPTLVSQKKRR